MAFDLDTYLRVGGRLDVADLDLEGAFAAQPLDDDSLRCLQYMHDIETHTVCYLRDILVTKAHADPELTTFLTVWNYEEHWHGEAIGQVLAAHGRAAGPGRVGEVRGGLGRFDRARPAVFMALSAAVPDITAVHMTWGALNEWTTQAGYALLAAKARHPVLSELLRRIMKQEGRHIDMYAAAARRRLAASGASRRVTRFALRRFWTPVGTGVRPAEETRFITAYLYGDEAGREAAARIDRCIDRLPGLAGLGLVNRAVDRAVAAA